MKKFWQNFKLKSMLFKIWFLKNLWLFVQIALLTLVVLIFTGVVTPDTPILGKIPLIKDLINEIYTAINEGGIKDVMTFLSVLLTVMLSVGMFLLKARSISQADIKSDKLKLALVTANLYFNKEGRLVKKVEKATGKDIDGDGKVDDIDEAETEYKGGIIKRTINAVREFTLIMSADFSEDEEKNKEKYNEVIEKADLKKSEEAAKEIGVIIEEGKAEQKKDEINVIIDKKIEEVKNSTDTPEDKAAKISFFEKLKQWFARKIDANKQRKLKRKEEKAAKKAAKKAKKASKNTTSEEIKKPEVQLQSIQTKTGNDAVISGAAVQTAKPQQPAKKNDVDDFIAGIKRRR